MSAKKGSGLSFDDFDDEQQAASVTPAKPVAEKPGEELKPIGTNFRMMPADWRRLKDLSTAERRSFQELIEEGLASVFAKRGLDQLTGMPRTKNKAR